MAEHEHQVRAAAAAPLDRSSRIALISAVVVAGFACAVAYHYYLGVCVGLPYPANTYLFRPHGQFRDFFDLYWLAATPEAYQDRLFLYNYFPFAHLLVDAFIWLEPWSALLAYLLPLCAAIFGICWIELRESCRWQTLRNALILALLSYPIQFAVDRANNEGLIFLFLYLYVWAVRKERFGYAAVPLALALAMKPFPAVFLVLLVISRRFKEAAYGCVAAVGLNLVATNVLHWQLSYNFSYLTEAAEFYSKFMVVRGRGIPFGHSLWGTVWLFITKFGDNFFPRANAEDLVDAAMKPYFLTVIGTFLAICWFLRYERVLWKQVALLTFSMNLFPYISSDYKLLHTLIPLFCFVNAKEREPLDWAYGVLFALLLIPKNYLTFDLPRLFDANLGILLNPLIMVVFTMAIIGSGLSRRAASPAAA